MAEAEPEWDEAWTTLEAEGIKASLQIHKLASGLLVPTMVKVVQSLAEPSLREPVGIEGKLKRKSNWKLAL